MISGEVLIDGASRRRYTGLMEPNTMNPFLETLNRPEADGGLQASTWRQSIRDEVHEVAWLSFIVAALSMAGVGIGIALALTLEG